MKTRFKLWILIVIIFLLTIYIYDHNAFYSVWKKLDWLMSTKEEIKNSWKTDSDLLSQYHACNQWKPLNSHCILYWNNERWYNCSEWYRDTWWECAKLITAEDQKQISDMNKLRQDNKMLANEIIRLVNLDSKIVIDNSKKTEIEIPLEAPIQASRVSPIEFDFGTQPIKNNYKEDRIKREEECKIKEIEYYRKLNIHELCGIRSQQEHQKKMIEYEVCKTRWDYLCDYPWISALSNCWVKPTKPFCF